MPSKEAEQYAEQHCYPDDRPLVATAFDAGRASRDEEVARLHIEELKLGQQVATLNSRYESSEQAVVRLKESLVATVQECHRHWLFLKHERDNGGNYEHMNTRMVEAEYLEERLRALLAASESRPFEAPFEDQGKQGKPAEPSCADCGHPASDSSYHFEAPGTNWGAALHHFRADTSRGDGHAGLRAHH